METAVCWTCVNDEYLKAILREGGEPLKCSVCHGLDNNAYTVEQLGALMEPIMREHFSLGKQVRGGEQEGDSLDSVVPHVLGQYFDFNDELVDAVIDAEGVRPDEADSAFFDETCNYVESKVISSHYDSQWSDLLKELKHERRFFSQSAQSLFSHLFAEVESLQSLNKDKRAYESVVHELPKGSELFRARICDSESAQTQIFGDPFKHVGPPPVECARSGRMNAEGVVVFYGAIEQDTCLAEVRPALGCDSAIITLQTTQPLRLLDFTRIERMLVEKSLSYFRSDFAVQVEKRAFLLRLHTLISQPVTPGKEADYLITQTMAEYLAYLHHEPFDGILFKSAQHKGGTNVVLFADPTSKAFPLAYVHASVSLFATDDIKYTHRKKDVIMTDGKASIHHDQDDDSNDDF